MLELMPENWRAAINALIEREPNRQIELDRLWEFLENENDADYHPNGQDIFAAFRATSLDNVRVVIIGQDPYPKRDRATGLAFSLPEAEITLSKSIKRIYEAIENNKAIENSNIRGVKPEHGNLDNWASEGVLLLNRVLTFRKCNRCKANIHRHQGWEFFTEVVVKVLSNHRRRPIYFMLWGGEARKIQKHINENYHTVLPRTSHPTSRSPYFREFLSCRHFSIVNTALGEGRINWFPPEEDLN